MAFAGFSPGEAEGLRRAMSRKRSAAAIEAYHQRFVEGAARTHGVDEETAERVYAMIVGFSGFGFPKAHGAAFGLLAYQSTWLRVHYGPEFLCALLNEQPMGFYALGHARRTRPSGAGSRCSPPTSTRSEVECTVDGDGRVRHRARLRAAACAPPRSPRSWPRARRAGRSARWPTSPRARAPGGRRSTQLAWAGACDALAGASAPSTRAATALWQLGVAAPGERGARRARSSRCRSSCPARRRCEPLDAVGRRWSPTTRRPG